MSRTSYHRLGIALAVASALLLVVAIARGLHETPGASIPEILGLSAVYAALFGLSAWMFRRAAGQSSPVPVPR